MQLAAKPKHVFEGSFLPVPPPQDEFLIFSQPFVSTTEPSHVKALELHIHETLDGSSSIAVLHVPVS